MQGLHVLLFQNNYSISGEGSRALSAVLSASSSLEVKTARHPARLYTCMHDNIHHNSTSHSFIFRCRFVLPQELHLGRNSVGIDGARQLAAGLAAR